MNAIERPKRDHAPEQRWQHGADRAETNGTQHVASTIAALRKSAKIGDAEVAAASRFYADFAFASGARDPEKSGSGGGAGGYSAAQIDAITRYNAARVALGSWHRTFLHWVVVEERSIRWLSYENSGAARAYMTGQVVEALKALSDHYAAADGARAKRVDRRAT